jgi:hypothetical protein
MDRNIHWRFHDNVTDSTNSVVSLFGFLSASMSKPPPRIDADIVCLQEVAPASFEEDFSFMEDLGYDGKEMF